MPDFIETIINGIKAWVGAELTKLRQLVTSTRRIAEKAQATADGNKVNPVFTGSFSQNRKDGTKVGDFSHAEGYHATATGDSAHSEGLNSAANGNSSHAEGRATTASGQSSHAEGRGTIANGQYQHAQGKFNIEDTSNKYAHIVGNGTTDPARSNAHTLDWNGVPWFQGRPQFGGTAQDNGSQAVMANGDAEIILTSSTPGSTKKYKITVDDTGTLSATEVTE